MAWLGLATPCTFTVHASAVLSCQSCNSWGSWLSFQPKVEVCDFMVWQIVLCTARRCLLMQLSVSRCGYCACPLRAPWTVDVLSVGHGGLREYDAVITSCALVAFLQQYQCLELSRVCCVHCHGSCKRVCWCVGMSFLHGQAAKACMVAAQLLVRLCARVLQGFKVLLSTLETLACVMSAHAVLALLSQYLYL